jgi:hypothetical protein
VDNGPLPLSQAHNRRLYDARGARTCRDALRPGGVLAVWSAGPNMRYEQTLRDSGLLVETRRVPAFTRGSSAHVLFLGARAPRGSASQESATSGAARPVVTTPRRRHRS